MSKKTEIEKIYSLSPMQQGMLYHWLMVKDTPGEEDAYYRQCTLTLTGEIDVPVFMESIHFLFERHDALRTIFVYDKIQKPKQVVLKKVEPTVTFGDLTHITDPDQQKHFLENHIETDKWKGFDLTKPLLMRMTLFKTASGSFTLHWSYHHIIMDGWCLGILFKELDIIYQAKRNRIPVPLAPVTSYRNYIKWLDTLDMDTGLQFWRDYLSDYDSPAVLPTAASAGSMENQPYRLKEIDTVVPEDQTRQLEDLANRYQVTLNTLCRVLWGILLQRYNNTGDVVFGATVSGRPPAIDGIEQMVGLFINTIPIRIHTRDNQTIAQLLTAVQETTTASQSHEYLPLADIQAVTPLKGDLIHHILVFESFPFDTGAGETQKANGPQFSVSGFDAVTRTNYPLALILDHGRTLTITFNFNSVVYDDASINIINTIASQFRFVLEQVIAAPDKLVDHIDILSPEEKHQLLVEFNDTEADYPHDKTIHRIFAEQMEKTPNNIAVVTAHQSHSLSYDRLNRESDQLACLLQETGVQADTIVALMLEPSLDMIIAILAVLKAGGAYMPIDPNNPDERIRYLLNDSNTPLLLTTRSFSQKTAALFQKTIIHLDDKSSIPAGEKPAHVSLDGGNLAYVIYTSGTTGRPKGVLIQHKNVVRLLFNDKFGNMFDFNQTDVWTMFHSYNFDFSVWEMYGSLLYGGKLILIPRILAKDTGTFLELLHEQRVTVLNQTPSAFYNLVHEALGRTVPPELALRYVIFGGEALSPLQLKEWQAQYPHVKLINMFGITETTVHVTYREITPHDITHNISNIGKPIPTLSTRILDKKGRLAPIGTAAELYVQGDGLARGYLNRPELTAQRFVNCNLKLSHPSYSSHQSHRSYKTGDLVRITPNGHMEYLGRIDHQVQIRGYRVELGEIQSRLLRHPAVKEVVVIAREDAHHQITICAYIVPLPSPEPASPLPDSTQFKQYLSAHLPDYMIPTHFIPIESVPLTSNGKVDRRALPEPLIGTGGKPYTAPSGEIQEKLADAWSEVLGIDKTTVSIHADFFDLGGHSLKVTLLISKIHKELEVRIPMADVFQNPTIREMADYIKKKEKETFYTIPLDESREFYPLSSAQKRLYVLQQMTQTGTGYNMPLAVEIHGPLDRGQLETVFRTLIRRHESLRTSFHLIDDEPLQKIHNENTVDFDVPYHEDHGETGTTVETLMQDFIKPFDLSRAPLFRVALYLRDTKRHLLIIDLHHIISDGVSMGVLVQEFITLYRGGTLAPLHVQYKDFSQWQNRLFASQAFQKQEKYWLEEQFSHTPPQLTMPLDFPRPDRMTFAGHTLKFPLDAHRSTRLTALADSRDVTLNILFFTLYAVLLGKYADTDDIVIGSLVAGRNHADLENVMGMFGNFLPIRIRIPGDQTFDQLLQSVKTVIINAYDHQDYPFEKIVDQLKLSNNFNRNPLFDTMLVFHSEIETSPRQSAALPIPVEDLRFNVVDVARDDATLDFKLDVYPGLHGLELMLQYNTALFKKETMETLLAHFNHLVDALLENPDATPQSIPLFSPEEQAILEKHRHPPEPFPLVVSASFTADPISNYIQWWCRKFDLEVAVQMASYNQVFQQLIDVNSPVSINKGANLILVRFEDWIRHADADDQQLKERLDENFRQLRQIITNKEKSVPYFFGIFPVSRQQGISPALVDHLETMNRQWQQTLQQMDNVYIIDFNEAVSLYRIEEIFDPLKDREGHMPFSDEFYATVGTYVARKLIALKAPPKKVIVLDCDNTLWKGICGEDGTMGVRIEGPYKYLQEFVLRKLDEGMVAALCSKNNEPDVWEVFEKNPGMILKKEHLVGWRINWNPKSGNIQELAAELNLGIDSFIFIDDNPMECSVVTEQCPEVLTLLLPEDTGQIPAFLDHIWAFDRLKVTEEDKKRTQMYITERRRREVKSNVTSLEDFLQSLELDVTMAKIETPQISRASQLTQRTNQFNMSTIRRSETEMAALLQEPGIDGRVVYVKDRFGDYGLVGVIISKMHPDHLFIDTFLLSCRVLGRTVEDGILVGLKKYCEENNVTEIRARFRPTPKNKPFIDFTVRTHWEKIEETDQYTDYRIPFEKIPDTPGYIHLNFSRE